MAAPAYQTQAVTASNFGAVTITKPTGVVTGDVLIAFLTFFSHTGTITPPTSWVLVDEDDRSDLHGGCYSKIITNGAGEPADYTWGYSAGGEWSFGAIFRISGCDTTTPVDISGSANNSSSTSLTAPSITTTVADTLLMFMGTVGGTPTYTPPSGMSELVEIQHSSGYSGEVAAVSQAGAGATGTKVATLSGAAAGLGILIALKPVAAAATHLPFTRTRQLGPLLAQ